MAVDAWIGLGNMGGPMTRNLVEAGHSVRGVDLDPGARAAAAAGGVQIAGSVAQAVEGADAVFTMLPKGEHVRAVFAEVLAAADPSALLLDSSTVDIETSKHCHESAAAAGFRFVDAPVSGGISGAAAASLCFMLGGEADAVQAAAGFVEPMSGKTIAAGGPTAGIAAKICNNMMLFIDLMAASEGSQLAEHLGLDPQVFWEIASVSSGRSWAQQTWYPVPDVVPSSAANHNFEATFRVDLARKDIGLALEAGERTGVKLPAAELARGHFDALIAEGLADKDCSLMVKQVSPDGTVRGYTP